MYMEVSGVEKPKEIINSKIFDEVFNSKLTEQEKKFILYYLESYNARQSYIKAFGCDVDVAKIKAFTLLQRKDVQSQIRKLKKVLQVGYDIDPSRYIEFLLKAANADIGDYIQFSEEDVLQYDKDGSVLIDPDTGEPIKKKVNKMHLVNSKDADTSLIVSVKQGRDGISLQMVDKLKCWEKIKDFFEWKMKQEEKGTVETNIIQAIQSSTNKTWGTDDVYSDLEETLKDDNNG